MSDVKLLSKATNYAVVQLPGRAFPGVVFQGDSLASFIGELDQIAVQDDPAEKAWALRDLIERFRGIQAHYEAVLDQEGISLPYTPA